MIIGFVIGAAAIAYQCYRLTNKKYQEKKEASTHTMSAVRYVLLCVVLCNVCSVLCCVALCMYFVPNSFLPFQEIAKNLQQLFLIDSGFHSWYKRASPKEQEMAQRISDAILADVFSKQGKFCGYPSPMFFTDVVHEIGKHKRVTTTFSATAVPTGEQQQGVFCCFRYCANTDNNFLCHRCPTNGRTTEGRFTQIILLCIYLPS